MTSERKIPKPISCFTGSFDAEAAVRYPHLIDPDWLSQNENWIDAYPEYKQRYLIVKLAYEYQAYRCPPKDALCSGASYPIPYPATLLSGSWSPVKAANNPNLIDPNWLASNPHWIEDYEELKLSWGEALHELNNADVPVVPVKASKEVDDWQHRASKFEPLTKNRFLMAIEGLPAFLVKGVQFSKSRMVVQLFLVADQGFSVVPPKSKTVRAELKMLSSVGDVGDTIKFNLKRTEMMLGEHDLHGQDAHCLFRYDDTDPITVSVFFDIEGAIEFGSTS